MFVRCHLLFRLDYYLQCYTISKLCCTISVFKRILNLYHTSLPASFLVLTVVDNGAARGSKYCDTLAGATPVGTTTVQGIEWTVGAVLAISSMKNPRVLRGWTSQLITKYPGKCMTVHRPFIHSTCDCPSLTSPCEVAMVVHRYG